MDKDSALADIALSLGLESVTLGQELCNLNINQLDLVELVVDLEEKHNIKITSNQTTEWLIVGHILDTVRECLKPKI